MIENLTGGGAGIFAMPPVFPWPAKIVRVNLDLLASRLAAEPGDTLALHYLGPQEQARFHAFRYEKRKIEWLAGRIAAKCAGLLLHHDLEQIGFDTTQWLQLQIAADSAGRPYLVWPGPGENAQLHISISHSRGFAVAMAARNNCGIDIQEVTPAVERVEERFAPGAEKDILGEIVELYGGQAALTLLWSAKEAVKKSCRGPHMPGFLDIRLQSLQKSEAAYLFGVRVVDKESGHTISQQVWVRLLAGFAYAVTMHNQV